MVGDHFVDKRMRDIFVIILACVAGCMDTFAIIGMGGVFIFALTGNTVFMAISIVDGDYNKIITILVIFATFIPGILLGTKILGSLEVGRCWNQNMTKAMILEVVLVFIFFVLLYMRGDNTELKTLILPIAVSSFAMGLLYSITMRLVVKGAMVTMITGMLIKLFNDIAFPEHSKDKENAENAIEDSSSRPFSEKTNLFLCTVAISFFIGALICVLSAKVYSLLPVIFVLAVEIALILFVVTGKRECEINNS